MRLPVQFFRQLENDFCVAACVKMLLAYYGVRRPLNEIAAKIGTTRRSGAYMWNAASYIAAEYGLPVMLALGLRRKGISSERVMAYLKRHFAGPKKMMTLRDIVRIVATKKRPVIVCGEAHHLSDRPIKDTSLHLSHAVVVVGYSKDKIFFLDPAKKGGLSALSKKNFRRAWELDYRDALYIETTPRGRKSSHPKKM